MIVALPNRWQELQSVEASQLPLPTLKDEAYRFFPIRGFSKDLLEVKLESLSTATDLTPKEWRVVSGLNAPLSREMDSQLWIGSLEDAARSGLAERFYQLSEQFFSKDVFASLAKARSHFITCIYVAASHKADLTLRHQFREASKAFYETTLVIIEEGAELEWRDIVESDNLGDSSQHCSFYAVSLGKNSKLTCHQIAGLSSKVDSFVRVGVLQKEDSKWQHHLVMDGSKRSQWRVEAKLFEPKAESDLKAALRASDYQNLELWSDIIHQADDTKSSVNCWNLVSDQARTGFSGLVDIPSGVRGADAFQKNTNLLLSESAQADSLPKLKIASEEVKCFHGSTVTSLDEESLFYLQSRGLSRKDAEKILIDAFLEPVVGCLPDLWRTALHARWGKEELPWQLL